MTRQYRGLTALFLALGTATGAQEPAAFRLEMQKLVAELGQVERAHSLLEQAALERIYSAPTVTPLWSTNGVPTRQALEVMRVLESSPNVGLVPADYEVDSVTALAPVIAGSLTALARFDLALSRSVVRHLADLHLGRVDPQLLRFDLPESHERLDLAALVAAVAIASDVPAAFAAAEPPYEGYKALKRALTRYRQLAADTLLRFRRFAGSVRVGDSSAHMPALRRLLTAVGDLDSSRAPPVMPNSASETTYDRVLMAAVIRFQRRHGLDPDGVIGAGTMAQLATPLARRVRQIELTLERWRWLPDRAPARYAVVNIPAFRLYVFEEDSTARQPVLAMNAIVGEARDRHGTPVFVSTMREVVFRPYWDVPPSIARRELIPLFRRRPSYYEREGFEIVRVGEGGDHATVYPPTTANFARVAAGELRLRQRPGPTNALGPVKFVFPNRYNVFLHGTPAQELFARSRRDFSHGCIRIEEPAALAELVLRNQGPWNAETIDAAMRDTRTRHVSVERPVVVYVLYATVTVDPAGTVWFSPDLYRHDIELERALGLPPVPQ